MSIFLLTWFAALHLSLLWRLPSVGAYVANLISIILLAMVAL